MYLLVREDDLLAIHTLFQREWIDMVSAEGNAMPMSQAAVGESDELPCPACGTAAPLVEGACSDCGLMLE